MPRTLATPVCRADARHTGVISDAVRCLQRCLCGRPTRRSPRRAAASRIYAGALLAALFLPTTAVKADDSIDPTLIPDGTYPAHVDRVINAQHIAVTMQGTLKVFLASARSSINFLEKVKANDDIDVTLSEGKVIAFNKK